MSSGGTDTVTQTQKADPWEPAQPYLQDALASSSNLYYNYQPSYYPGQTYVGPSSQTLLGLDMLTNYGLNGNAVQNSADMFAQDLMAGSYMLSPDAFFGLSPVYNNLGGLSSGSWIGMNPGDALYDEIFNRTNPAIGYSDAFARGDYYLNSPAIGTWTDLMQGAYQDPSMSYFQDFAAGRYFNQAPAYSLIDQYIGMDPYGLAGMDPLSYWANFDPASNPGVDWLMEYTRTDPTNTPGMDVARAISVLDPNSWPGLQTLQDVINLAATNYAGYGTGTDVANMDVYNIPGILQLAQLAEGASMGDPEAVAQLRRFGMGEYVGENPYLDAYYNSGVQNVLDSYKYVQNPAMLGMFEAAGGTGSQAQAEYASLQDKALLNSLGNYGADLRYNAYNSDMSNMFSANTFLAGLGQQQYNDQVAAALAASNAYLGGVGMRLQGASVADQAWNSYLQNQINSALGQASIYGQGINANLAGAGLEGSLYNQNIANQIAAATSGGSLYNQGAANAINAAGQQVAADINLRNLGLNAASTMLAGQLSDYDRMLAGTAGMSQAFMNNMSNIITGTAGLQAAHDQAMAEMLQGTSLMNAAWGTEQNVDLAAAAGRSSNYVNDLSAMLQGNNIINNAYTAELNAGLTGYLGSVDDMIAGMNYAPISSQLQLAQIQSMLDAGTMIEGYQALPIQEAINRWNFEQNLPYQQLNQYIDWVTRLGGMGGTTYSTGEQPGMNPVLTYGGLGLQALGTVGSLALLGGLFKK